MEKGSGTRSGLLWEVERILSECENRPQILLMENVPQVHGAGNDVHFKEWQLRLEEFGYQSYWQDLTSVNYGIPQSRNRTFMVSILGDYNYRFPKKQKLKLRLKDLLESEVDDKYVLSPKLLECFMSNGTGKYPRKERFLQNLNRKNQDIGNSVTTLPGQRPTDNFVVEEYNSKRLNKTLKENEIKDGDFIDAYNQKVYNDVAGTITTRIYASNNTFVSEPKIMKVGNYSPSNHNASSVVDTEGLAPTVMENHGTVTAIAEPSVIGGIGDKKSNGGTQWYQQDRVYDDNVAISVTTSFNPNYMDGYRIRKLTPRELFRLMGLKDEDINLVLEHQTDSKAGHLAGDSIVVNVLMAIFSTLCDIDWTQKFNPKEWWIN